MTVPPVANADPNRLIPALSAGIRCRCPRCGKGALLVGFLDVAPECDACGLDYGFVDAGDGPAVFVIMLAGFLIVGAALVVEARWHPPLWLHAVLWVPLTLGLCLGLLRPLKGVLIALQFHHRAREGRIETP